MPIAVDAYVLDADDLAVFREQTSTATATEDTSLLSVRLPCRQLQGAPLRSRAALCSAPRAPSAPAMGPGENDFKWSSRLARTRICPRSWSLRGSNRSFARKGLCAMTRLARVAAALLAACAVADAFAPGVTLPGLARPGWPASAVSAAAGVRSARARGSLRMRTGAGAGGAGEAGDAGAVSSRVRRALLQVSHCLCVCSRRCCEQDHTHSLSRPHTRNT